jgi:hypothetical protein
MTPHLSDKRTGTVQDEGTIFLKFIEYKDNLTAYNTWLPKRFQGHMIDAVNKTYPVGQLNMHNI